MTAIATRTRLPHDAPINTTKAFPSPVRACIARTVDMFARQGIDLSSRNHAAGHCDDVSRMLARLLAEAGCDAAVAVIAFRYRGEDNIGPHHTVTLAGGRVLDLTANQYARGDESFPVPYVPLRHPWVRWLGRVQFRGKYAAATTVILAPDAPAVQWPATMTELRAAATPPAAAS